MSDFEIERLAAPRNGGHLW